MAEVKNSFLGSKMNQDLDDRLVPNNEYREGLNISVSNSEQNDVGALQTVLGNQLIASTGETIIGSFVSEANNTIFLFSTDYTDISSNSLNNFAPTNASCKIYSYNVLTDTLTTLVSGFFLNFSTTHNIYGVNLLENLLFWTDNRNQPRKINIQTAANNSSYYSSEDHISVAKYAPFQAIQLYKETTPGSGVYKTTMKDVTSEFLPDGEDNPDYQVDGDGNPNYAGDKNYLSDRFVRFSYRFKFDDGEYSIMAPFTQPAFIPKQDGSFIDKYNNGSLTESDEDDAYKSSIVKFMENKVNNIKLIIPFEYPINEVGEKLKVNQLEILFSESDSNLVKSIEEIPVSYLNSSDTFYEYDYQSTKPVRVLPSGQTTRVYDKVPVKALAQEIIGNRVVYSNYINKHTAPLTLDYSVNVSEKLPSSSSSTSRALEEYPEHTLKQNRNYQVGIVLSDRYGRQSGVILAENTASLVTNTGEEYGSSTIYSPYKVEDPKSFFGNSLKVLFNSAISSTRSPLTEFDNPEETGEPGLYAEAGQGIVNTLSVGGSGTGYTAGTYDTSVTSGGSGTGLRVTITTFNGSITGALVVESGSGYNVGDTIGLTGAGGANGYLQVASLAEALNPLGWYSYKVVVKQTEQEYYNVYVPDIISEISSGAGVEENIVYVSLINDNINKVPRDLSEVGPDQKSFSSSTILYPRVDTPSPSNNTYNEMFDTTSEGSFVGTIATLNDLTGSDQSGNQAIYQAESNPLIGKVLTPYVIGKPYHNNTSIVLGVLETKPTESLLDIYWETSTSGLISELNALVASSNPNEPSYIVNWDFNLDEADVTGTSVSTSSFQPRTSFGDSFTSTIALNSVIDGTGVDRTSQFTLTGNSNDGYNFETTDQSFYYGFNASIKESYTFNLTVTNTDFSPAISTEMILTGSLSNVAPTIDPFTPANPFPQTYLDMSNPICTFTGENGAIAGDTRDLSWTFDNGLSEITSYVGGSYQPTTFYLTPYYNNSAQLTYTYSESNPPDRTISLNIVLTDAGGLTDTVSIAVDFNQGEFDPSQFTTAFDL
jgi:hypothetical protein